MVGQIVCPCPGKSCNRHGDCAACREKHRRSAPYCERPPKDGERRNINTDEGGVYACPFGGYGKHD